MYSMLSVIMDNVSSNSLINLLIRVTNLLISLLKMKWNITRKKKKEKNKVRAKKYVQFKRGIQSSTRHKHMKYESFVIITNIGAIR